MFKIRCSAIGEIMAGNIGLTEVQSAKYYELKTRKEDSSAKRLTDKMLLELADITDKKNNPQLPQTAKTYVEQYQKEQIYSRKKSLSNKYINKGLAMEDEAIEYAADKLGWGFAIKNEQRFEDDFMMGTPDIILPDSLYDIKCSWDCFTFPLFATKLPDMDYYWQVQGYMSLTGKNKAKVVYVLMDTPIALIEKQAWYNSKDMGYDELDQEILNECIANMTYPNIEDKYRIKAFDVERNNSDIMNIQGRVLMCQQYLDKLK